MKKITIIRSTQDDFFARGKELAAKLDAGEEVPEVTTLSFPGESVTLSGVMFFLPQSREFELHTDEGYLVGMAAPEAINHAIGSNLYGRLVTATLVLNNNEEKPTLLVCASMEENC